MVHLLGIAALLFLIVFFYETVKYFADMPDKHIDNDFDLIERARKDRKYNENEKEGK